jgi:hypothetical protein
VIFLARVLLANEFTMSMTADILDAVSPAARLMFGSPLLTPAASVAIAVEVVWLASSLALLFWLARQAREGAPPHEPPRRSLTQGGAVQDDLRLAA